MTVRWSVAAAVCLCLAFVTVPARAADPSAKSFVEGIYAAYKGKDAKGVSLDSNAAVRRYFDPKLAALIIKDRREAHGEVGKLDADPFVGAQDGRSTLSTSPSARSRRTRRARRCHSKAWAISAGLSLLWSSSRWAGGSPTSLRTATKPCANF